MFGSAFFFFNDTATTGIFPPSLHDALPISTATKYFLLIDGLDGGSTDAQHVGWFEINSFDLDLSSALAAAVGGGGTIGRAHVWTPVTRSYRIPSSAGKLKDSATGKLLKSIK